MFTSDDTFGRPIYDLRYISFESTILICAVHVMTLRETLSWGLWTTCKSVHIETVSYLTITLFPDLRVKANSWQVTLHTLPSTVGHYKESKHMKLVRCLNYCKLHTSEIWPQSTGEAINTYENSTRSILLKCKAAFVKYVSCNIICERDQCSNQPLEINVYHRNLNLPISLFLTRHLRSHINKL